MIKLGEYLIDNDMVRLEAIQAALEEQKITGDQLGMILVRNGFLSHKQLVESILAIAPERIITEQAFSTRIPPEILIEYGILIVAETDTHAYLATMAPEAYIHEMLLPYYPDKEIQFLPLAPEKLESYLDRVQEMSDEEASLVDNLIRNALVRGVSDVHIIPRYASYSVMFRYLGVRHLEHEGSLEEYNTLTARIKDRARMDLAERRIPQDGGFQVEYNGKLVDMRVATLPTPDGEVIVIRLLDPDRVQPSLDKLGISDVEKWRHGVSRSDGLCLICGPTGSGKTTTLNATVKEMDRFGRAVYTVEDPVEYRISYTGQININHAVSLDFARAVKAFMRADPDIIVLGEIRDVETARNAIKAAETGHLVLGTIHTGSIRGAVDRLRDLDVESHELKYLLRAVLVQRLMRVTCQSCGGAGCHVCHRSGYTGRSVVSECEYFEGEDDVVGLIEGKVTWPTMADDAGLKYKNGVTDEREVVRVFGQLGKGIIDKIKESDDEATEEAVVNDKPESES